VTDTAVSVDCFGTLVTVPRPEEPAGAVGEELVARGVRLPNDWTTAYREAHIDMPDGGELSLSEHTRTALASRGVDADPEPVTEAVLAAFDREVTPVPGARDALAAVENPVGVLSNCSVPGLVTKTLRRADLLDSVETVETSVDCGWRKPDPRAFEAVADPLGVDVENLVHVGDNAEADGGIEALGGTYLHVEDDLFGLPDRLVAAGVSLQ
jgi:HAD superfamily hydrolase (TIGR01509 family)